MEKIKAWIKNNKLEFGTLFLILLVGAILRLYKIDQYLTFLGDEGRDVIIVSRFLKYFDIMLIGPGTSIGNMYLGPLYYYMMAPALLIANFSPVGPAVMVAILGIITIAFVWWVGREWFSTKAGLVAAALYAISPTVILYSRSSWNPNVMPFFALLCIYSVWKINESRGASRGVGKWLWVLGIAYAFVLQSHYLGLLLLPTLGIYWFISFLRLKNESTKENKFLRYSLFSIFLFSFLMSPLVIFDARHGWRNFSAMSQFLSVKQDAVAVSPLALLPKMGLTFGKAVTNLLTANVKPVGMVLTLILVGFALWIVVRWKKLTLNRGPLMLLFCWLAFAFLGLGLLKQEVYDHYFGFVFTALFLFFGALVEQISTSKKRPILTGLYVVVGFLLIVNIQNSPLRRAPNQQLPRAIVISRFIADKAAGQRFNLATISDNSNRDVYQYFLALWGDKVVDTDPAAVQFTVTDQLFVVCEKTKEKCDPTHDPSAWITNFGWTKIVDHWEVWGTQIYKLGHTK